MRLRERVKTLLIKVNIIIHFLSSVFGTVVGTVKEKHNN